MKASPEALLIMSKMKGDKPADDTAEEADEGDVSSEAAAAACENVFKAIRGRAPNEQEANDLEEALEDWMKAKGY